MSSYPPPANGNEIVFNPTNFLSLEAAEYLKIGDLVSGPPGVATASKALILDANKDFSSIRRGHFDRISVGTQDYSYAPRMLSMIDNAMTAGPDARFFAMGKSYSTRNSMEWSYQHIGDGSTSNRMDFSFFGVNGILAVRADRRVGINQTNPTCPLHVTSSASITIPTPYTEIGNGGIIHAQSATITRDLGLRVESGALFQTTIWISSDRRLKKDITDLDLSESLKFVQSIEPKKYKLKVDTDESHRHIGYIAQDLLKAGYVDLLNFTEKKDFPATEEGDIPDVALSVDYQKVTVILHRVLMDVLKRIEALESL